MAQALSMQRPAFKNVAGTHNGKSRGAVVLRAAQRSQVNDLAQVNFQQRFGPSMLAVVMTLSTGLSTIDVAYAPVARADEEETMSPYQKRQAELEKRREMLREAREKAAARAAAPVSEATPAPAPAPAPSEAASEPATPTSSFASQAARLKKDAAKTYEEAAKKAPVAPPPAPEPSSAFPSFQAPADPWKQFAAPAPAPALQAPAPTAPPAPVAKSAPPAPVAKPAPPAPVAKPAAVTKKTAPVKANVNGTKRRGPLPLWLTEILLLGVYVGVGLAVTKYCKESSQVTAAVGEKIVEAYNAVVKLIKQQQGKSA